MNGHNAVFIHRSDNSIHLQNILPLNDREFVLRFSYYYIVLILLSASKQCGVYISFLEIPSPPIGLKVDSVYDTSIYISWQPPDDAKSIIRKYQVSYTIHGESEQLHEVQDTTSTELTSLEPDTEYSIRVRAKMILFGDYSTPITIHTLGKVKWRRKCIVFIVHNICFVIYNHDSCVLHTSLHVCKFDGHVQYTSPLCHYTVFAVNILVHVTCSYSKLLQCTEFII